ncbi:MAG: phosphatidylserine decarboxylase [Elusimicrobia bacterium]|nr:phosphatidylserine decarboxylase [Elusimicrobiota bacterium]
MRSDPKILRLLAQLCRWVCYIAWSYVWVGAMFLLMLHQVTPYLLGGLTAALGFFALAQWCDPQAFTARRGGWLTRSLVIGGLIGFQLVCWRFLYFFRDPERTVPRGAAIVAPADGFVVYIRRLSEGEVPLAIKGNRQIPLEEILRVGQPIGFSEGYIVGIFMTPMSVHVNRAPISGAIGRRTYIRGSRMVSMMPMSLRTMVGLRPFEAGARHLVQNERETLLIRGEFPVYLTRIADSYVDKVVTWKSEGDPVSQGERIGLIKMGSQTDLVFPAHVNGQAMRIQVHEGQYVYAGSTTLAIY